MLGQDNTEYKIAAIGFYNVENLFDTLDTEGVRDTEFTPTGGNVWNTEHYNEKIANMASVIHKLGTEKANDGLSLLGVAEIENKSVLVDLVNHPQLRSRNYSIVHYDSEDKRGIDVALLYQPTHFRVKESKPIRLDLMQSDTNRLYTRDILYVSGLLDGEPLTVLVNHWPSRSGGEKRSGKFRNACAAACRSVVDSLSKADPKANIIIMGDLNDDPNSTSLKSYLKTKSKKNKANHPGGLYNAMYDYYKKGIGSNAYRDSWSLFDQIILSSGLLDKADGGYFHYQTEIFNKKFLVQKSGRYKGYPRRTFSGGKYVGGYSDHFPVFVYLIKKT